MRTASTALLAATLLLTGATAHAAVVLPPGATWEYTFDSTLVSDPDWNTEVGTAGWLTGPAPFGNCQACGFDPNFDYNTLWPADGTDGDDLWVRTTIDLTGYQLSTAAWNLGVDNGFKLYANGVLVQGANAEGYTFRWEYNGVFLPGTLVNGVNVIAVALEDHGGLTAFDMQVTADAVPEPASLLLFGTGAAVLARARRRSRKA